MHDIYLLVLGYGDFAPVTPAGRSVFVIWAMLGTCSYLQELPKLEYTLGVAAMTILISGTIFLL